MPDNVTNETIHDFIEQWHEGDSVLPLHTYLGLTSYEYAHWVITDELPTNK